MKATKTAAALRQLRAEAAQLSDDIADMTATLNRLADRLGWGHPEVMAKDAELEMWKRTRSQLSAAIRQTSAA